MQRRGGQGWERGCARSWKWHRASHLPRGRLQTPPWVLQRLVALPGGENWGVTSWNLVPLEGRPDPLSGGMAGAQGSKQSWRFPQETGEGLWTPLPKCEPVLVK